MRSTDEENQCTCDHANHASPCPASATHLSHTPLWQSQPHPSFPCSDTGLICLSLSGVTADSHNFSSGEMMCTACTSHIFATFHVTQATTRTQSDRHAIPSPQHTFGMTRTQFLAHVTITCSLVHFDAH